MTDKERIVYLEAALRKIAERTGRFSRDPLEHAENCIESMGKTAEQALAGTWEAP